MDQKAGTPEKRSTPHKKMGEKSVEQPQFTFTIPDISPIPRLNFLNQTLLQNTSFSQSPYVPKLPIFSGAEEPQKGETSYEVWNFEVKCLPKYAYLPEYLLLQAIRNSLEGTARIKRKAMIRNRYNYPTPRSETSKGKKHKHEITRP